MSREQAVKIRELAAEMLEDYLAFFDREAFSDNPEWATCYCYFNHAPHQAEKWERRSGEQNRAAVTERICSGQMHGYLAYRQGKAVGWCNAGPRRNLTTVEDDPQAEQIEAISCFVIAPGERRQGIARRLLEAALEGFRRQGYEIAEGYPRRGATSAASNYHGPLAMYLEAGFTIYKEEERVVTVRKLLK